MLKCVYCNKRFFQEHGPVLRLEVVNHITTTHPQDKPQRWEKFVMGVPAIDRPARRSTARLILIQGGNK